MGDELQNTGNNFSVSCLGWRWHRGKKTVFMPRCSSASVASAWREKHKQVMSRVRGVCDDVTCPFLHSGVVQILKAGQVHTNDPFCCPNSPLQSSYIWYLRINRGLYFISNVLFDLTNLVIGVCFSYALDPWLFIVSFSLAVITVFVTHICYDKNSQKQL